MIRVSAPGSIMLLGEHAVLEGQPAVAAAVNRRLIVELSLIQDVSSHTKFVIESALGKCVLKREDVTSPGSDVKTGFEFVTSALSSWVESPAWLEIIPYGLQIRILSVEMPHTVGLGTSAAVSVAVHAACSALLTGNFELDKVLAASIKSIMKVQGVGSGTDAAASTYGGLVRFQKPEGSTDYTLEKCFTDLPLFLVNSGKKMKTVEVIAHVNDSFAEFPKVKEELFDTIGAVSDAGWQALKDDDLENFYNAVTVAQELMISLGVCHAPFQEIFDRLSKFDAVKAAKISGSGLGDCAVAFGTAPTDFPFEIIPISIAESGVRLESV